MLESGLLIPVEHGLLFAAALFCIVQVRVLLGLSDGGGVDACLNQDC